MPAPHEQAKRDDRTPCDEAAAGPSLLAPTLIVSIAFLVALRVLGVPSPLNALQLTLGLA